MAIHFRPCSKPTVRRAAASGQGSVGKSQTSTRPTDRFISLSAPLLIRLLSIFLADKIQW